MNFNKRSWVAAGVVAVCLVAAGGATVLWKKSAVYNASPVKDDPLGLYTQPRNPYFFGGVDASVDGLISALILAVRSGSIKLEDFEKLDFSMPGDPAYGDNPDYEVFNPEGKIKAKPLDLKRFNMVMSVKGLPLIYNLQRYIHDGRVEADHLVLLIPNATYGGKDLCSYSSISRRFPMHVATDNSVPTDIVDTTKLWGEAYGVYGGCTLGDDGNVYYAYRLIQRYRSAENPNWVAQ